MRTLGITAMAAVLFGPCQPVAEAATVNLTVGVSASGFLHQQFPNLQDTSNDATSQPSPGSRISSVASVTDGAGGASASMNVGLGYFAGNAIANVNFDGVDDGGIFPGTVVRGSGFARGTYNDEVTISAPGLDGQPGTLTAQMRVSGSASVSGNHRGSASWTIQKNIGFTVLQSGGFYTLSRTGDTQTISSNNTGGDTLFFEAPFIFGEPFAIGAAFSVSGSVGNTYEVGGQPRDARFAEAQSFFGNSAEWGGIDSILGPDGAVIDAFLLTSASGLDWSSPVGAGGPLDPEAPAPIPVPAALPLLATAFAMIGAVAAKGGRARRDALPA